MPSRGQTEARKLHSRLRHPIFKGTVVATQAAEVLAE